MGPADPAAELIQLGEAEVIGAVHDHRVRGGNVEAVLDDRGSDENTAVATQEAGHRFLELALGHLAVGDRDRQVGHQPSYLRRDFLDRLHPVVHEEDLATAIHLETDGVGDRLVFPGHDVGDNRLAVARRSTNQRQVAQSAQRQVQGPRNGRGRHGEHVHAPLQRLEPLLLDDAELLLLVDYQQAHVFESHIR